MKIKFRIFGMIILIIASVSLLAWNMKKELFTKDYYIGVITVQGDNKPEINFYDKNLVNIGKI